ncbi:hypothetical protein ACE6H2_006628 [Prunus campanulata]
MPEQPKKEIPIRMPINDKPLATIIEGRWYSVGKSGRPTLELTRIQKRRVQRQYCTFLRNKKDAQVLPELNSARRKENPEVTPQAEQAGYESQKLIKTESPGKPSVHSTSSSVDQPKLLQVQAGPEPIPKEGQQDWTEENEEEQLDYEPSAEDQTSFLETEEQEDWTEEMEYDGGLDEETEAFGAELENLLQGDLGINMVFILSEKFRAVEGQNSSVSPNQPRKWLITSDLYS